MTMEDAEEENINESDKFVNEQLQKEKKNRKTFTFSFTRNTTDDEIYLLNHKRASRIATKHAEIIGEPLSASFIADATTEQIYEYLIQERNEFCFEYEYEQFQFNGTTTDTDIKKLQRAKLENFICFRYRDTDRSVSNEFFSKKTDIELKYILTTERDMMRATSNHPDVTIKNPNDPKPPNTLPKGLHAKRQNLNGWNIDSAMTKSNQNLHSKVYHPSHNDENDPRVLPMSKNYFFIRAKISTEGNGTHTPTIVRRFFKALRNSDSTMQLHPFDKDDMYLNNILDTESLIPDDSTALLTWVRGLYSTTNIIHFSIRVPNT